MAYGTYTRPSEGYPPTRKTTRYTPSDKSLGKGAFGSIQEVCCEKDCSFAQKKQGTAPDPHSVMDNELIFFDELWKLLRASEIGVSPEVYDYTYDPEEQYGTIVMEKMDGTLANYLRSKGVLFYPVDTDEYTVRDDGIYLSGYVYYPEYREAIGDEIYKKLEKLNQKLFDIDIYHDDLHLQNIMYKRYGDMYVWKFIDLPSSGPAPQNIIMKNTIKINEKYPFRNISDIPKILIGKYNSLSFYRILVQSEWDKSNLVKETIDIISFLKKKCSNINFVGDYIISHLNNVDTFEKYGKAGKLSSREFLIYAVDENGECALIINKSWSMHTVYSSPKYAYLKDKLLLIPFIGEVLGADSKLKE